MAAVLALVVVERHVSLVSRNAQSALRTVMRTTVDLPEPAMRARHSLLPSHCDRTLDSAQLSSALGRQHIGDQAGEQSLRDTLRVAFGPFATPAQRDADDQIAACLVPEADRATDYRVEARKAIGVEVSGEES